MKNLLYFEYKKNCTVLTVLLSIIILFVVANLVVFLLVNNHRLQVLVLP